MANAKQVQIPQMAAPIVESDGRASSAFRSLIETLWRRTGGLLGQQAGIATTTGDVLDLNELAPVGEMVVWPAPEAPIPLGWLACDGSAISRQTYSALFSVIGSTFGSGDGVSTFNVPNAGAAPIMFTSWIIRALPEASG